MKKLTIAIPTYNRCNYLQDCLDSILSQITDEIDIVISDNASTDETQKVALKYNEYTFIHYYRNDQNLGMDGNFLNCLIKAEGKYIHLMSDDDIMLPGTIKAIIDCINNDNPCLIHMNTCSFRGDFTGIENCSNARFNLDQNFITYDKDLFLGKIGVYITYLSSLVLKNELVKRISEPEQFLGTFFMQSHMALLITEGDKALVILNHNSIAARSGNTGGYNLYKIWTEEYKKLLLGTGVKAGYDKKCMEKLYIKSIIAEVKGFILDFRLVNTGFDLKGRNVLIKNTYMYPSVWLRVYPVSYLPISILRLLRNIRSKLKSRK